MSKVLAGLAVLQTLAIAFLAARIVEVDQRLLRAEEAAALKAGVERPEPQFIPADAVIAEAAPASADAEMIRRVIREEMATALRGANSTSASTSAPAPK
ncbi:MAG: hypothetical protein AAB227_05920, partial [Pseudomonadota bacterium]